MRPSLTRRLLAYYVVTILLVVGGAATLVWAMMSRALHASFDTALRAEAEALAATLEADEGRIEFDAGLGGVGSDRPGGPAVQIATQDGLTVFSSTALSGRSLLGRVSHSQGPAAELAFNEQLQAGGEPYRFAAVRVQARLDEEIAAAQQAEAPTVWVFVGRPLAPVDRTLNQLASVLIVAVVASGLAALAGGYLVTRRGVRPVRVLATAVGRVDPAAPTLEIDRQAVPLELQPVVATTDRLLERVRGELERQRQLTADVAHDLRTPVAGVRTLMDVCLQRDRSSEEYRAALEKSRGALRQLSLLLDDVLTLSRLEAGVDRPAPASVAMQEVVASATEAVEPLAAARNVHVRIDGDRAAVLPIDRAMLTKLLTNLLANAIEHSPTGGLVDVSVATENGTLQVAVADEGPGIPADLRDRIFERFVRGDAARTNADGHHGLGLPIAAGLARALGGDVSLDRDHVDGARFIIRLPLTAAPDAAGAEPRADRAGGP